MLPKLQRIFSPSVRSHSEERPHLFTILLQRPRFLQNPVAKGYSSLWVGLNWVRSG